MRNEAYSRRDASSLSDETTNTLEEQGILVETLSSRSDARPKAREQIERHTAVDARGYGGRRTGFKVDGEEQAKKEAMERHLLELARRAIRKDR